MQARIFSITELHPKDRVQNLIVEGVTGLNDEPAQSTGLHIIEQMWLELKRKTGQRNPLNFEKLWETVTENGISYL